MAAAGPGRAAPVSGGRAPQPRRQAASANVTNFGAAPPSRLLRDGCMGLLALLGDDMSEENAAIVVAELIVGKLPS